MTRTIVLWCFCEIVSQLLMKELMRICLNYCLRIFASQEQSDGGLMFKSDWHKRWLCSRSLTLSVGLTD